MKKHEHLHIISMKDTNMNLSCLCTCVPQKKNEPANTQGKIQVTWPSMMENVGFQQPGCLSLNTGRVRWAWLFVRLQEHVAYFVP